jgi:acyl carrier protein
MTPEEIKSTVIECLNGVAPEADLAMLDGNADLRDTLDIDSMDFLRFVVTLHEKLRVDIPEREYPEIRTLDACIRYLGRKLESHGGVGE